MLIGVGLKPITLDRIVFPEKYINRNDANLI